MDVGHVADADDLQVLWCIDPARRNAYGAFLVSLWTGCWHAGRSMAPMAQAADLVTARDVRDVVFPKPPMGKRGYDEKSVNDFLQLVARRLDGRGRLTADDVRDVRFPKPPVFKRGYHDGSVDDLLDRVATTIDGMDSS